MSFQFITSSTTSGTTKVSRIDVHELPKSKQAGEREGEAKIRNETKNRRQTTNIEFKGRRVLDLTLDVDLLESSFFLFFEELHTLSREEEEFRLILERSRINFLPLYEEMLTVVVADKLSGVAV